MLKTSEGSPRAALLHQAVSKGQSAAHISPLSFVRPSLHGGPVGGVMSLPGLPAKAKSNKQAQAALIAIVMHLLAAERGNTGGG